MRIITICLILLSFYSCSDSASNDDGVRIDDIDYEDAGSNEFLSGNYQKAIDRFEKGVQKNLSNRIKSRLITYIAFAKMRIFTFNLDQHKSILKQFEGALILDDSNNDARLGKLLMHYVYDNNYNQMIELANQILSSDATYSFILDVKLNHFDVKVMKALAHYQINDYAAASSTINLITAFDISSLTEQEKVFMIAKKLEELIIEFKN